MYVAVKIAYQDVIERDRYPVLAIFININPYAVDVNVHPCKNEVRFQQATLIRQLIVNAISAGLHQHHTQAISPAVPAPIAEARQEWVLRESEDTNFFASLAPISKQPANFSAKFRPLLSSIQQVDTRSDQGLVPALQDAKVVTSYLGLALALLDQQYLLSQTAERFIIVDINQAQRCLTYETLKADIAKASLSVHCLELPELVTLAEAQLVSISRAQDLLAKLGIKFDISDNVLRCYQLPLLLRYVEIKALVYDLAEQLIQDSEQALDACIALLADHHQHYAEHDLSISSLNNLLRCLEEVCPQGCEYQYPFYCSIGPEQITKLLTEQQRSPL